MNACLQCLLATKLFDQYFNDKSSEKEHIEEKEGTAAQLFIEFLKLRGKQNISDESLTKFKKYIETVNSKFEGYQQQDSHEGLSAILEVLIQDFNRVKTKTKAKPLFFTNESIKEQSKTEWILSKSQESSIINDLFQGQLVYIITCDSGNENKVLYNFDNFTSLSLDIPEDIQNSSEHLPEVISLYQGLEETFKTTIFDEESGYNCQSGNKKTSIRKSISITRLPKILIIHLNRFTLNGEEKSKNELEIKVDSKHLDLSVYIQTEFKSKNAKASYNLYGIVNHSGSLESGHYTSEVRSTFGDNKWYECNDRMVREIISPSLVSNTSYLLFYCRTDQAE